MVQVFLQDAKHKFAILRQKDMTAELMFKGVPDQDEQAMAVNWLIAMLNQYIYQANHKGENLSIQRLEAKIRFHERMEGIPTSEKRIRIHQAKYNPLKVDMNFPAIAL